MLEELEPMRQSNARRLKQLKKWQKAWDALVKEQAGGKPDPSTLKLCLSQLAGWAEVFPYHQGDLAVLESSIADLYQEMMRRYESELRRVCKRYGYEIEGESPNLTVDGLVRLNINKE